MLMLSESQSSLLAINPSEHPIRHLDLEDPTSPLEGPIVLSEVPASLQSVLSGSQKTPPALDRGPYQLIRLSELRTPPSPQRLRVLPCFQMTLADSSLIKLPEDPTILLEDQPSKGPNDAPRGPHQPSRGPMMLSEDPTSPPEGPMNL